MRIGAPAADVSGLGIRLSEPPLEAPILMQHTLRYVISTEPQKRADYFKALLEVSDLETVRTAIFNAKGVLNPPASSVRTAFERCRGDPRFAPALSGLEGAHVPAAEQVAESLREALGTLVADVKPLPETLEDRIASASHMLQKRREATFPLQGFDAGSAPSWRELDDSAWTALAHFVSLKSSVDRETVRLAKLFEVVLEIPTVADATAAVDCPVCETPKSLTRERIAAIQTQLGASEAFRKAQQAAGAALRNLTGLTDEVERSILASRPVFLGWDDTERARRAFTEEGIGSLLGEHPEALVAPWRQAIAPLKIALGAVTTAANGLRTHGRILTLEDIDTSTTQFLREKVSDLVEAARRFADARAAYMRQAEPLVQALREEVDKRGGIEGWNELIDLARQPGALHERLTEKRAHEEASRQLNKAIEQINAATAQVLDDKFSELGGNIAHWWELLRPDESTSFDGIQRGGTGRRFIDLKARMIGHRGESSGGILRDAVAVFSDSQLNCLGLASFLARTVEEGGGFVVLDDPVPASDEEHRAMFVDRVLKDLVDRSIQVIVITHDERMWKDVQESYKHLDLDTFLITLDDPSAGAVIENRSDTLDALLARATPYIDNTNPDIRKIGAGRLRDAAERFCKLLLVQHRLAQGDPAASVSDYDNKNLRDLVPKAQPFLDKDPSHPGKFHVIGQRLNPGAHDHVVPPSGDLRMCLGDLRTLRKVYLR